MVSRYQQKRHSIVFCAEIGPKEQEYIDRYNDHEIIIFDPSGKGKFPSRFTPFTNAMLLQDRVSLFSPHVDRVDLFASQTAREAYPQQYEDVFALVRDTGSTRQIRHNTLKKRFEASVKATTINLPQLASVAWYEDLQGILSGVPVFIVSAGPSLDKNGALLKECSKKGVIFAVNSSAGCVPYHGAQADMVATLEALGLSEQLEAMGKAKTTAISLSAHPDNFTVKNPKFGFISTIPAFERTLSPLGYKGIPYGTSVSTCALVLARYFGADTFVLLGQDLAYTNNRVYASGTGREHITIELKGGKIIRSDIAEQTERYKKAGLQLGEAPRQAIPMPGYYGDTVQTTHDMLSFARWFESFPGLTPEGKKFYNSTEGGVFLNNWDHKGLREVLDTLPDIEVPDFTSALSRCEPAPGLDVKKIVDTLWITTKNVCGKAANARMFPDSRIDVELNNIRTIIGKCPIIDMFCAAGMAELVEKDLPIRDHNREAIKIIYEGAKKCFEVVSGVR